MPTIEPFLSFRSQASQAWLAKFALVLLLIIGLFQTTELSAQGPATALEFLDVELWPDFDRPSVLVLMTGALPANASLPATITIPLPEEATINAVARVDAVGDMFTDLEFDESIPGQLTLTATDPTFRIEYYVPYESDGDQRDLSYQWLADLDVNQLTTTFQQPSLATDVTLAPEALRSLNGQYNLLYHEIQSQAVPAGVPYTFEASYRLIRPELSAELIAAEQPSISAPADITSEQSGNDGSDINWIMVLAAAVAVLAFAAVAWLIYSNQTRKRRVIKPRPAARPQRLRSSTPTATPSTASGKSKFCHECGQPLDPSDKFCSNCGTVVKGKNI